MRSETLDKSLQSNQKAWLSRRGVWLRIKMFLIFLSVVLAAGICRMCFVLVSASRPPVSSLAVVFLVAQLFVIVRLPRRCQLPACVCCTFIFGVLGCIFMSAGLCVCMLGWMASFAVSAAVSPQLCMFGRGGGNRLTWISVCQEGPQRHVPSGLRFIADQWQDYSLAPGLGAPVNNPSNLTITHVLSLSLSGWMSVSLHYMAPMCHFPVAS